MIKQTSAFRNEALEYYLKGSRTAGDLVRISSRWVELGYRTLLAGLVALIPLAAFARINQFVTGVAVIRDEGRSVVTSRTGGTITMIGVAAGERVQANQRLLQLNDTDERIELDRLRRDLDLQQITWLRNPGDPVIQQHMATISSQIGSAEKRLSERSVFAPRAGRVRDMRIRPGEMVAPGQSLRAIVDEDGPLSLIVVLPGHCRPRLRQGGQCDSSCKVSLTHISR
jgi:multidrug efflux pump subunit AcrA (membrane-fusion protein)